MTIDEAIKHCLEVAENNEAKAQKIGVQFLGTTKDKEATECRECAADHRQLAEWLTELKEAKRLLKLAVKDFKEINSDILTCKYCKWNSAETGECAYCHDNVPCEQICGWEYEGEALKLIGGSENE